MNLKIKKVLVCGAGGFIDGHLVRTLLVNGADVVISNHLMRGINYLRCRKSVA